MAFVYILFSKNRNRYYVGQTVDLKKRLIEHTEHTYKDAYTSKTNDWVLFYKIECISKPQAIRIEKHIKRMKSKTYIQNLKKFPSISEKLLVKYQ